MEAGSVALLLPDSVMLVTGEESSFVDGAEYLPSQQLTVYPWMVAGYSMNGDRIPFPNGPATETPPGIRTLS